jgi:hypothetical protein
MGLAEVLELHRTLQTAGFSERQATELVVESLEEKQTSEVVSRAECATFVSA